MPFHRRFKSCPRYQHSPSGRNEASYALKIGSIPIRVTICGVSNRGECAKLTPWISQVRLLNAVPKTRSWGNWQTQQTKDLPSQDMPVRLRPIAQMLG
jgi:hypothetical protein